MDEPNEEGLIMRLDYTVSSNGKSTIDVAYFDPTIGFDYRKYDPMDITPSRQLRTFENGSWKVDDNL